MTFCMPDQEQDLLQGRHILVVEDELSIAMLLEEALLAASCILVGPVGRFNQAMALAREAAFQVALLDVNLRGIPAFPVADILVARGIPFVFLTGYGRADLPPRFDKLPILSKPFHITEMLRLVARLPGPSGKAVSASD